MKTGRQQREAPPTIANDRIPLPPITLDPDQVIGALEAEIGRAVGMYHRERARAQALEAQLSAAYQQIAALTAKAETPAG